MWELHRLASEGSALSKSRNSRCGQSPELRLEESSAPRDEVAVHSWNESPPVRWDKEAEDAMSRFAHNKYISLPALFSCGHPQVRGWFSPIDINWCQKWDWTQNWATGLSGTNGNRLGATRDLFLQSPTATLTPNLVGISTCCSNQARVGLSAETVYRSVTNAHSTASWSHRTDNVLNCLYPHPGAAFKLICFPWAGSGSTHFAKWGKSFHHSIEVSSIRLPGRESRFKEPFATTMDHVVAEISNALLPILRDVPFAFFGHSMGSYVAFMTALHLKKNYKLQPVHFFVSSATPPHVSNISDSQNISSISEEQLIPFIMSFGGTPNDIFENKEFLEIFLPIIKADFQMIVNFTFVQSSETLLSCDSTCFSGTEDVAEKMEDWKDLTSGSVETHRLPGNHFYLTNPSNETFIINYITRCLQTSYFA
ncbi:S-acyl fatty acid synthase thioesterase, medium chain [Trichosurus vulpecula]|uniref:S-acyl fatty acid synthase thioesterase, medium chain n=1 Tax=Trichosurus vulpecula TaxID=9337 RepID=UPI00186AFDE6|nr:S-acyl fatty acid synthase thioesterase, medium chain [Trichosurus vulpecula]